MEIFLIDVSEQAEVCDSKLFDLFLMNYFVNIEHGYIKISLSPAALTFQSPCSSSLVASQIVSYISDTCFTYPGSIIIIRYYHVGLYCSKWYSYPKLIALMGCIFFGNVNSFFRLLDMMCWLDRCNHDFIFFQHNAPH